MKNLVLLLALLLAACGSKDKVSTTGELPGLGNGGQDSGDPFDTTIPATKSTLIQIACQSNPGISLPNSQMISGQRFTDMLPARGEAASEAPTVLGVEGDIISTLFVSNAKVYLSRYDFSRHALAAEMEAIGSAGGGSSEIYRKLGFRQPRLAATSPNGKFFVFAGGGSVSLRSVKDPARVVSRWNGIGAFTQPRWDGNEIFIDRNSAGRLRQALIEVEASGAPGDIKSAPPPLSNSFHQIGLRRFDADSYIWLERSSDRAVLRVWSQPNGATVNYELPEAKDLGPGFALVRSSLGTTARAVMNSRTGLTYFTLNGKGSITAANAAYPGDTQNRIENREMPPIWSPGAVYSAAGDTQLFVVLPSTFGDNMLFSVEGNSTYRLLGFETCLNPDFYRTRN